MTQVVTPTGSGAPGDGEGAADGAVAEGIFVNYGLQREHVGRAAALIGEGAAGADQLMFAVSLAADPVRTVELFGREVLPALRG